MTATFVHTGIHNKDFYRQYPMEDCVFRKLVAISASSVHVSDPVTWRLVGQPEVIQKRASGRSLEHVLEADFWGVSEISFVDYRLFAWHNFRLPVIQMSLGYAVQCDSSMRIAHGGRALRESTVT